VASPPLPPPPHDPQPQPPPQPHDPPPPLPAPAPAPPPPPQYVQPQYVQWQLQQEQQQQPWAAPSLFADLGRRAEPPPVPHAPRVTLGQGSAFALSALGQPEPAPATSYRSPARADEEPIRSRLRSPPTAAQR